MHIKDILDDSEGPTISFEFFPAKTAASRAKLRETIETLSAANPAFVSITYGAGGSTREATQELVRHVKGNTALTPVPHFTCVNHSRDEIDATLRDYAGMGIGNVLALRGDAPRDRPDHDHGTDFCRHATDLVRYIRQFNATGVHPDHRGFGIGVAGFPEGHPATPNRLLEIDYLKAKVDAGADYICTQLFFDNRDFYDFVERCDVAGIRIPILAGILPITSIASLKRMSELAAGARVPGKLLRRLFEAKDNESVYKIGIDHASEQCADLYRNNIAGIHFYTLDQADPTLEILGRIENGVATIPGRLNPAPAMPSERAKIRAV
ncbi:MAG: methylenetetrahydrofolate reductase [NAD(P)H] [Verrucomicrobiales bacterium]|nr:methylenetetrahydrofolate reductase [NAD(P)H] [Verrucomicrobiales bacterium]